MAMASVPAITCPLFWPIIEEPLASFLSTGHFYFDYLILFLLQNWPNQRKGRPVPRLPRQNRHANAKSANGLLTVPCSKHLVTLVHKFAGAMLILICSKKMRFTRFRIVSCPRQSVLSYHPGVLAGSRGT